jgi:hypothetical protein
VSNSDIENSEERTIVILDRRSLENEACTFNATMLNFSPQVMASDKIKQENPLTVLWNMIYRSTFLTGSIPEFCKGSKIAVVTVVTSVEDERTFSTLSWMKSKVRNRLNVHLDCTLRLFSQPWYSVSTFPYMDAVDHWKSICDRRGV